MFAATIVCLLGVLYNAASNNATYASGQDALSGLLLFVIILSTLYIAFAVIGEAALLYVERKAIQAQRSAANDKAGRHLAGKQKSAAGADNASANALARTRE